MAQARTLARALSGCADLVEKYRLLEALRQGEAGRTEARRDAMRAIAARFPGALREWDEAPLEEIARRRNEAEAALARLVAGGAGALPDFFASQQSWLRLGIAVHERLREALALKRFLSGRAATEALAAEAREALGVTVDGARLAEIAAPPQGRVSELVYREVAREAGVTVGELKAALFFGRPGGDASEGPDEERG